MSKGNNRERKSDAFNATQLRALMENADEGVVIFDMEGKIKHLTSAGSKIIGFHNKEIIGKRGELFLHPEEVLKARKVFETLQKKPGKSIILVQRIRHKKGHYLWSESRLTSFAHVPEINGIVSNFRDVTEEREAEERARRTSDLLEVVNHNISEGIFMGSVDGSFTYANYAFLRMAGYAHFRELEKVRPGKIFSVKNSGISFFKKLRAEGVLKDIHIVLDRGAGKRFCGMLNARLVNHEGNREVFVGTLRDVTSAREIEDRLAESQNLFNNIINTVAAPIFIKDSQHRWIMCNDSFCELVGKSRKAILGKSDPDFVPAEEARQFWKADNETLKSGRTVVREEKLTLKGRTYHLLTVKSRYINEKGERFIIGFLTNITHLKNAQEEIQHLHENLEGVLESSKESIFSVDKNLRYIAFNKRHKQIMRILYGANITVGADKIRFFNGHPDARWVKSELMKALGGHHFVTDHYQDFKGYKGHIQTTYNPIRGEDNKIKGVAVFVQDITQRKDYEGIINSINASLRSVMESTSDGIVALDRQFRVTLYNNSFAKGFKKLLQTEISKGEDIKAALPPHIRKMVRGHLQKAFSGMRLTVEEKFPSGDILEIFYNPVVDDTGNVTGAALFIRNISEKKRIEEHNRMLNKELLEQNVQLARQEGELKSALKELSDRNYELDQLMYKTSHDLRSPLSSIIGLINLANLDNDPRAFPEYLSKIEGRAKKLDEFIRSMLDYARVNRVERDVEAVHLPDLIQSCISELEYMDSSQKLRTEINIDPIASTIRSDRLRMKIIFSNIISNAFKYMNADVDSYLRIQIKSVDEGIDLTFDDNGIGIREEHIAKIFNMFYRATERSQGSGLGMYIVKQAVEKLDGTITLSSQYGKGTQIKIILPEIEV